MNNEGQFARALRNVCRDKLIRYGSVETPEYLAHVTNLLVSTYRPPEPVQ